MITLCQVLNCEWAFTLHCRWLSLVENINVMKTHDKHVNID